MNSIYILLAITLAAPLGFAKGDAKAGAAKATTCAACHGANGVSTNDLWPDLKGQKAGYLAKQLNDFKTDKRKDPVMSGQAKTLSAKDMQDLAAYYSTLK